LACNHKERPLVRFDSHGRNFLIDGLITACKRRLSRVAHALQHHPKHVSALVMLVGAGGAALAVASAEPAMPPMPAREILETVEPLPLGDAPGDIGILSQRLYRSDVTRANDTIDALLSRLGISDPAAVADLRSQPAVRSQVLGRAGRLVTAEASETHALQKLIVRWAPEDNGTFKRLVATRSPSGQFQVAIETAPLSAATRMGSGTIQSSLFQAVDDARIPDVVATQLIDIFSGDIDFQRTLYRGDRFSVVYEALEADGEPMRTGRILSAEFVNAGRVHHALWFQEPGQKGGYYTLEGKSLRSSYLASPMEFSRVTSGFKMRMHPIQQQWKAHLGVDYGAPTGAPVRAVGDGVVEFAGVQNGFGNVVTVKHNHSDSTLYAHLSRIDVRPGQAVEQGQRLGAVGSTGWATGPHLHFEFRVNGVHRNPTAIARHESAPVSAEAMPAFQRVARSMRAQLASAATTELASAD